MPARTTRSAKSKDTGSQSASSINKSVDASSQTLESDLMEMSIEGLLGLAMERNNDPVMERILSILSKKIPKHAVEDPDSEKRSRSIVISGLPEAEGDVRFQDRQSHLENQVSDVMEALKVECRPVELYRMGKFNPTHPRLVKVVLPSKFFWRTALANARSLRSAGFPDIYIRKSMTAEERKRDYELRLQARERNRGKPKPEWVVYRSELVHVSELPRSRSGNA
ncbi:hypothetical protein Y032_0047g1510 [Ancylostoma ceylanicum]|uniref:Uncharacterized protein n=1 Tax=Ancylostoma ceylanicum TaxID=53326 RepID=A0A016UC40_9BILA|nr:hypothetical protein Y032_0047g1510 [Ancylostoma ceylanicum]